MKYTFSILAFSLLLVCGFLPTLVLAHTLKIDGPIGITMHIDPDDDPVARLPGKVFFYFKDETGKLDLDQCDCNVTISNGSSTLFSESFQNKDITVNEGTMTVSFPFVFPKEAVYEIAVEGVPASSTATTSSAAFSPFKLTYIQRVDTEGDASSSGSLISTLLGEHVAHIILFGGAILASLYLIYIDRKEQAALRKKKAEGKVVK